MQSLTPEEQRVLERLKKKLPRMPSPGWDKERLLDELGWKGCPCEENWRKVCGVILKCRRMVALRKAEMPIIGFGRGGYLLLGFTGPDGRIQLFCLPETGCCG